MIPAEPNHPPRPASTPGFHGGVGALLHGTGFLLGRPRLWPWAVLPVVVTMILYVLVIWGAIALFSSLAGDLTGSDWGFFSFLKTVIHVLLPVLGVLVVLVLAYFTFTMAGTAIASPFLDILSGKTEKLIRGEKLEEGGSFWQDAVRSVGDALRLVVLQIGVLILSLPLNLIPVAGTVAWIGLGAWLSAFDYLDFPLARHRIPWNQRWIFLRRHIGASLGFGLGVFGLLLIPLLNLLILPVATVAATLLYVDAASREAPA